MSALIRNLSSFCLVLTIICGAFLSPCPAAGASVDRVAIASDHFAGLHLVRSITESLPEYHIGDNDPTAFNEAIARFRRSGHYQHPKSNAPLLFHVFRSWHQAPVVRHEALRNAADYYPCQSKAISDYYSFLFRLTPF